MWPMHSSTMVISRNNPSLWSPIKNKIHVMGGPGKRMVKTQLTKYLGTHKYVVLLDEKLCSDQVKILHMPWQLSCHGMCKAADTIAVNRHIKMSIYFTVALCQFISFSILNKYRGSISPDLNLTPLAAFLRFCRAQRGLTALGKKRKKAARGVRFKSGLG